MEFLTRPSFPACFIVTFPAIFTANKPTEMTLFADAGFTDEGHEERALSVSLWNYELKTE